MSWLLCRRCFSSDLQGYKKTSFSRFLPTFTPKESTRLLQMSTATTPATGAQPQSGPSGRGQKRGGNRGRGGHRGRGRGQANAGRGGGPNAAPTEGSPAAVVQSTTTSDSVQDAETGTEAEETLCHICTEPIKYFAVSECNHRTCHVCAVRLRALYKKLECVMCKVRLPFLPSFIDI